VPKARNALKAYRDIRRSIIESASPNLSIETVESLTEKTRGMREDDIREFLSNYSDGDSITITPDHPTNTCDPLTGNWAERMMDPFSLIEDAKEHGLELNVLPGFWSLDQGSAVKNGFKKISNVGISLAGTKGLSRSPYYILCGTARQH
jgi:hypothetical protein